MPLTAARDGTIVPLAGHTPGQVDAIVENGDHAVLLAGDSSYREEAILRGIADGVSPSDSADLPTHERIRAYAAATPTVYLAATSARSRRPETWAAVLDRPHTLVTQRGGHPQRGESPSSFATIVRSPSTPPVAASTAQACASACACPFRSPPNPADLTPPTAQHQLLTEARASVRLPARTLDALPGVGVDLVAASGSIWARLKGCAVGIRASGLLFESALSAEPVVGALLFDVASCRPAFSWGERSVRRAPRSRSASADRMM
jgi:hypothetical protein